MVEEVEEEEVEDAEAATVVVVVAATAAAAEAVQRGPFEGLWHFNRPRSKCLVGRSYRCPTRDENQCVVTSGDLVLPSHTNNAPLGTNYKK